MKLLVMDGQGGGIGATVIKGVRQRLGNDVQIIGLGTNSVATGRMMKAGGNRGATGENAVVQTCKGADIIVGPLAILMANAMMGEVTPAMAEAVCSCDATKILIPLSQERVNIVGVSGEPLPHLVEHAVDAIEEILRNV